MQNKIYLKVTITGIENGFGEWLELFFVDINGKKHERIIKDADVDFENNWNRIEKISFPQSGYILAHILESNSSFIELYLDWDDDSSLKYQINISDTRAYWFEENTG